MLLKMIVAALLIFGGGMLIGRTPAGFVYGVGMAFIGALMAGDIASRAK